MVDGWVLWVLLVGLAIGAGGAWFMSARFSRDEDDVGNDERRAEAAWISTAIERDGGIAPASLVEEVLDLHQVYLRTPGAVPQDMTPATPSAPPGADGPSPSAQAPAGGARAAPRPDDRPTGGLPPTRR